MSEKPWSPWPTIWWSILGVVVVLAGIGFGLWWWMQPNTDDIASNVKSDLQTFVAQDDQLRKYRLKVNDVSLVHVSGNEYQGFATVQTQSYAEHKVPIKVVWDGDEGIWETERSGWLFLLKEPA